MAAVLVLAVHGGGTPAPTGALDDALGYFPSDAPLVAVVDTNLEGEQARAAGRLLGRFPGSPAIVAGLTSRLQFPGVRFDRDIRPLLGHPLVVGLERAPTRVSQLRSGVVIAIRVDKPVKVKQLLLRQPALLPKRGVAGRRVFANRFGGKFAAAIDGHIFLAAGGADALNEALEARRSPDRLREKTFASRTAPLPPGAAVRVSADLHALIAAMPVLRGALEVRWVAALRRAAVTLAAGSGGVQLRFRAATDPSQITAADLPLSPTAGRPPLIGKAGEIAVGVRGPGRLVTFAAALARGIAPQRYARIARILMPLAAHGVDLRRNLAGALGSAATVAYEPVNRTWAVRIALRDPAAVAATLAKIANALPDLASAAGVSGVGLATPDQGENFYALARPGGATVVFGVVGRSLVIANRAPRAAALASEGTHTAPAPPGALMFDADAQTIAARVLAKRLSGFEALAAPLAVRALGDLTGSVAVNALGIHGEATLTVK